jgi:subtilisin family serine protease
VDTGFTNSDEFKGVHVESFSVVGEDTGDSDGHGTSVAALAVGQTFGVAPKASLVTIKISSQAGKLTFSDAERGILFAIDNITKNGRQNKAVINLSSGEYLFNTHPLLAGF